MTKTYRSSNTVAAPKKRRPAKKQHRFEWTSLAVLHPRRADARADAEPKAKRRKGIGKGVWARLRGRVWHGSHLLALVMLLGVVAALAYITIDSSFYVSGIEVDNARYTSAAEVFEQSGLRGYHALFVDAGAIEQRIAQLPHVREAQVQVSLPARVHVTLEERQPELLYQVQGTTRWVDNEGRIAPAVEPRDALPKLIDDDSGATLDERSIDPALLTAIQYISRTLPQVTTFRYQHPYGLYFISPEGWTVYLGAAAEMDRKLSTWEAARKQILKEQVPVQEVDLRYARPYWR